MLRTVGCLHIGDTGNLHVEQKDFEAVSKALSKTQPDIFALTFELLVSLMGTEKRCIGMKKLYTFMWNEEESQTQVSGPVSLR
jgi:hypothetical protein